MLTHWGRVTHICISKLSIIGSDNGLSSDRRQTIIWTNAGILLTGTLGTNFNEILIEIHTFSFKNIHLKVSSGKWGPFCIGLNVLTKGSQVPTCWWARVWYNQWGKSSLVEVMTINVFRPDNGEAWRHNETMARLLKNIHTEYYVMFLFAYILKYPVTLCNDCDEDAMLTHCDRVTHICVSKLTVIGSDNGLSPGRRQAIIWTNAWILLIWHSGTNFSEICIEIYTFSFKKMHLKMSSGKWQPFCFGLNVLTH